MKLLTNSIRRKFGACPRAYQHAYVLLRRPAKDHEALAFGTLVHKALEAWWVSHKDWRRMAAMETLDMESKAGRCDPYQHATARALMDAYDRMYEHQELETVAVEAAFTAPLMNPETRGVSKTWTLSGKIDARGKKVVLILSGGNIDLKELHQVLQEQESGSRSERK